MSHVDEGTLHAYLDGELPGAEMSRFTAHLAECVDCRARLEEERALVQRARDLLALVAPPSSRARKRAHPWRRLRLPLAWAATVALAFAIGFVAFGVGSGSTGIGDSLRGLFGGGSSTSVSSRIKDQQKKIAANPQDIQAYLTLASFYQQDNKPSQAVSTLERAAKVKPKNLDVLNGLARIYRGQAETAQNTWATAENALAESNLAPPGLDEGVIRRQARPCRRLLFRRRQCGTPCTSRKRPSIDTDVTVATQASV